MTSFRLLIALSMRSLVSHKAKSFIVGSIMFFGTMLLVVGLSLLDSIESSMERSVTGSVTGHLQVYPADAEDDLAIFGGQAMGEDIGEIVNFKPVKDVIGAVDNVKAIVPMGSTNAMVFGGNDFDRVLETMREAVEADDADVMASAEASLMQLSGLLTLEMQNTLAIANDPTELFESMEKLDKVQAPEFWEDFYKDPQAGLRYLETQIAPLTSDGKMYYMRVIGTDLDLFAESFDRFKLAEGEMVPPQHRGILLNVGFRERWLKHFVARGFDTVKEDVDEGVLIAEDDGLQARIKQNQRQYQLIIYQLSGEDAHKLEDALREFLGDDKSQLADLVQAFLDLDDANFAERYDFFYDVIAPMVRLYELPVGSTITLRGVTNNGYFKAVNVRIYGTYEFSGLEGSDLSGVFNLTDIMTFRDLYGLMTDAQREELADIREDVGVEYVEQENIEDALFGGDDDDDDDLVGEAEGARTGGFDEFANVDMSRSGDTPLEDLTFTQAEVDEGLALHAAIILEDPEKLEQTQEDIQAAIEANDLNLQVVDWQSAAGIVGQFVIVIRLVLYVALTIIFLVALVIINNSMVMATMDRVGEIGTMRAIGAQRGFVMMMFLFETFTLCLIAGGLGALLGLGVISWLGSVGISSGGNDVLTFLFSGPRLYPTASFENLLLGVGVIVLVTLASTLYPALIATRVQPIEAMQAKE